MIVLRSRAMGTKRMGFRKDRFAKRMAASARSQAEFSRLVKERTGVTVSQTHLSHIIVGKKLPSLHMLAAFSMALETNPAWLLGLTDDESAVTDWEDQVVFTVRDVSRRGWLQQLCTTIERLPDTDVALLEGMVQRMQAAQLGARPQAPKPKKKRAEADDDERRQELVDGLLSLVNAVAAWGGAEFRDELAGEVASIAVDADGIEPADIEILSHYLQQAMERLQSRSRGGTESGS